MTHPITIDLGRTVGPMKPLNGVNCAPYVLMSGADQPLVQECFTELHTPYSRLHDCCGAYGGCNYIDIPNIFRNFDADETLESSYDFHYSDEYIGAIVRAGTDIVYRLGITIEWGSKKYHTQPPADYAKWARICEHIIRHYNEGWADGFHYGIQYWEIWNEPENPPMWSGTKQQFFDLYRVASRHLKSTFPQLKIGGYGNCGFYSVTRRGDATTPFFDGVLAWHNEFLQLVKEEQLPLDFLSWHLYSADINELMAHAAYARRSLDEAGLTATESHLNEWNVGGEGGGFHLMRNMIGASYIAGAICAMQSGPVDKAMYYCFSQRAGYNGLLDQNLYWKTCTYYALWACGQCYALENQAYSECKADDIYAMAATKDGHGAAVVASYDGQTGPYPLTLQGLAPGSTVTVRRIYEAAPQVRTEATHTATGPVLQLEVELDQNSVVYIQIN